MDDEEHGGLGSSTKGLGSSYSGGPSGAGPVWKNGGTLFPSRGGTHYETETGGGGKGSLIQQQQSSWAAGIPRAARAAGNKGAGPGPPQPKLQPDNVGFRLLQKAGWNVGEGLGKSGDGILEPLKVYKKSDRRGIGGSSTSERVAVGEDDQGGDKATNQKNNASGAKKGDSGGEDNAAQLVMSKDQMSEYVRKTARDRHIASSIYRAFKEEEPQADLNPLLRRRKEQEEAELRAKRSKRKRERGGGDGGADGMSANNPLRGLW